MFSFCCLGLRSSRTESDNPDGHHEKTQTPPRRGSLPTYPPVLPPVAPPLTGDSEQHPTVAPPLTGDLEQNPTVEPPSARGPERKVAQSSTEVPEQHPIVAPPLTGDLEQNPTVAPPLSGDLEKNPTVAPPSAGSPEEHPAVAPPSTRNPEQHKMVTFLYLCQGELILMFPQQEKEATKITIAFVTRYFHFGHLSYLSLLRHQPGTIR